MNPHIKELQVNLNRNEIQLINSFNVEIINGKFISKQTVELKAKEQEM